MNSIAPVIEEAAKLVLEKSDIDGLLVFGSYARGDFTDESDIDFVTIGSKFRRENYEGTRPEIEVWTHPAEHYLRIINRTISDPFQDSLFLGILQESMLLQNDSNSIFTKAKEVANNWVWPEEVVDTLAAKSEKTQSLLAQSEYSEPIIKHIKQRNGLLNWNIDRALGGLPILRRLKDIHRKDPHAKIGRIVKNANQEDRERLHSQFEQISEEVLAAMNRPPFTEIKDTKKAFAESRFNEWLLSMVDSSFFLCGMGMEIRGSKTKWKLLDIESEIYLLEKARRSWDSFCMFHDSIADLLEI